MSINLSSLAGAKGRKEVFREQQPTLPVIDRRTQNISQKALKAVPEPLAKRPMPATSLGLDKKQRESILKALSTNRELTAWQLDAIFEYATIPDIMLNNIWRRSILSALAKNNNISVGLFDEIFKRTIDSNSRLNNTWRKALLRSLAANDNLSTEMFDTIFRHATTSNPNLNEIYTSVLLNAMASNDNLSTEQLNKILGFITLPSSRLNESWTGSILQTLATSESLSVEQFDDIVTFATNPYSRLSKEKRGLFLIDLANSGKINAEQYKKILILITGTTSGLDDQIKRNISQALDRNKHFNPEVFRELHHLNIIADPLSHLIQGHHLISDRINSLDDTYEVLLKSLNGMKPASSMYFFIDLLEELTTSSTPNELALKNLLRNIEKMRNIIENPSININDQQTIESLQTLIKNLNPGEGIPIPLGTENHAIIYEINRDPKNTYYSFAIINTGLGGEEIDLEDNKICCRKYSNLTLEEVSSAIKEAINLEDASGKYSSISYQGAAEETDLELDSIKEFNAKIKEMFREKPCHEQTIPEQKRGTCTWSSLDTWFRRYCEQNSLENLYTDFAILTAEEALNSTNTILENISIIILSEEDQTILKKQAIIINQEAHQILRLLRPNHPYHLTDQTTTL